MLKKKTWLAGVALALLSPWAWAQAVETSERAQARETEERAGEPRRKIRVLEHPYDIASFYRSDAGPRYFAYQSPYDFSGRYPIAGYYRQRPERHAAWGFAPYWGAAPRQPRLIVGYRRSLGSNADLFLIAPTFLAPVGPLTSAFFGH